MNKLLAIVLFNVLALMFSLGYFIGNNTLNSNTDTTSTEVKPVVNSEFTTEDMGGVYLITDNLTGCQYIKPYNGNALPRLYSDGIQVCGQSTYPNGEHHE